MTNSVKVVDASALAALLFQEPSAETIARRLQDSTLIAPALLDYELMNVCLNKIRRHPSQRLAYLFAFAERERIALDHFEVDADAVLALAEATSLTAYDASYLWLARSRNAELVTLDKKLEAAFLHGR